MSPVSSSLRGRCTTFGRATGELGPYEYERIGAVHQEHRFLPWMKVEQYLRYMSACYPKRDRHLERRLVKQLDPA